MTWRSYGPIMSRQPPRTRSWMISWVPLGSSLSATYEGTCDVILKETERQVNNVNDHNVAASIAARLLNQDQYRPHTICQCYYGCPLARCRLWSCLLVPLIRQHVQHPWLQGGCAAHRRTDEHQSTRKCQTGIPISFKPWSCFKLENFTSQKVRSLKQSTI